VFRYVFVYRFLKSFKGNPWRSSSHYLYLAMVWYISNRKSEFFTISFLIVKLIEPAFYYHIFCATIIAVIFVMNSNMDI